MARRKWCSNRISGMPRDDISCCVSCCISYEISCDFSCVRIAHIAESVQVTSPV